jgi:hypothetical protein
MKFNQYLKRNGLSTYEFARMMSAAGKPIAQSVVWRWSAEKQRPEWTIVPYITKVTEGKVTALDFVPEID